MPKQDKKELVYVRLNEKLFNEIRRLDQDMQLDITGWCRYAAGVIQNSMSMTKEDFRQDIREMKRQKKETIAAVGKIMNEIDKKITDHIASEIKAYEEK